MMITTRIRLLVGSSRIRMVKRSLIVRGFAVPVGSLRQLDSTTISWIGGRYVRPSTLGPVSPLLHAYAMPHYGTVRSL